MLDKVSVSKRKENTIVARVSDSTKIYVHESAKELGVSASAYVLQLIDNDRNPNVLTLYMDDETIGLVRESQSECNDETLSETISRLIKKGALNG